MWCFSREALTQFAPQSPYCANEILQRKPKDSHRYGGYFHRMVSTKSMGGAQGRAFGACCCSLTRSRVRRVTISKCPKVSGTLYIPELRQ